MGSYPLQAQYTPRHTRNKYLDGFYLFLLIYLFLVALKKIKLNFHAVKPHFLLDDKDAAEKEASGTEPQSVRQMFLKNSEARRPEQVIIFQVKQLF